MLKNVESRYKLAKELYASLGVDTDAAIKKLAEIPISLHCWQGDDVAGFEPDAGGTSGGILSTGNYPQYGKLSRTRTHSRGTPPGSRKSIFPDSR